MPLAKVCDISRLSLRRENRSKKATRAQGATGFSPPLYRLTARHSTRAMIPGQSLRRWSPGGAPSLFRSCHHRELLGRRHRFEDLAQQSFDLGSEFDRAAWPEIASGVEALPACCCCLPSQANIAPIRASRCARRTRSARGFAAYINPEPG
jgi:hypothetical protein